MSKLQKILDKLPVDVAEEMQASSQDELKAVIVSAEQAISRSKTELDASPAYAEAKENVKVLSSSYREMKKYQTAKIQYALLLLES